MSDIFKYITNTDINKIKTNYNKLYQGNAILSGRRDFFKELTHGLSLIQSGSLIEGNMIVGVGTNTPANDINYKPSNSFTFANQPSYSYCNYTDYSNSGDIPPEDDGIDEDFRPNKFTVFKDFSNEKTSSLKTFTEFEARLKQYNDEFINLHKIQKDFNDALQILNNIKSSSTLSDYITICGTVKTLKRNDNTNIFAQYFESTQNHVFTTFLNIISDLSETLKDKENIENQLFGKFTQNISNIDAIKTSLTGNTVVGDFNDFDTYTKIIKKLLTLFNNATNTQKNEIFDGKTYTDLDDNGYTLITRPQDNGIYSGTAKKYTVPNFETDYSNYNVENINSINNASGNSYTRDRGFWTKGDIKKIYDIIKHFFDELIDKKRIIISSTGDIEEKLNNFINYLLYYHSNNIIEIIKDNCYDSDSGAGSNAGSTSDPTAGSTPDPTAGSTSDPTAGSTSDPTAGSTSDPTAGSSSDPTAGSTSDPTAGSTSGTTSNTPQSDLIVLYLNQLDGSTKQVTISISGFSSANKEIIRNTLTDFSNNLLEYNKKVKDFSDNYYEFSLDMKSLNDAIDDCKSTCASNSNYRSSSSNRQACFVGCDLSGFNLDENEEIKSWDKYMGSGGEFIKNCSEYGSGSQYTACNSAIVDASRNLIPITSATLRTKYNAIIALNNQISTIAEGLLDNINTLKRFNINIIQNSGALSSEINSNINYIANRRSEINRGFSKAKQILLNARIFDAIKKKEAYDLRNKVWLGLAIAFGLATMYKIKSM